MSRYLNRKEILKLGAMLPLAYSLPSFMRGPDKALQNPDAKNILIILFDTLSAQHMSLYGYPRDTMPNLSRIAQRATVYHNHFAAGPFTTPGTASLLTGVYPWKHRAIKVSGKVIKEYEDKNLFSYFNQYYRFGYTHNPLAEKFLKQFLPHLEEYVRRENLYLHKDFLLGRILEEDFDTAWLSRRQLYYLRDNIYNSLFLSGVMDELVPTSAEARKLVRTQFPRGLPGGQGAFLLEHGIDFIRDQVLQMPQPYLSYFHFYPPHAPFHTRIEFANKFRGDGVNFEKKPKHFLHEFKKTSALIHNRRLYDEYILYIDAEFGRLFNSLESSGVLDNTWVIFTTDHGEMFERGIRGHTSPSLHQPVIRIPLLIFEPGQKSRRDIYLNTSAVDLVPTLLHIAGQDLPEDGLEGVVMPPFGQADLDNDRPIYALQARDNKPQKPLTVASIMLVRGKHKLVKYFGYKRIMEKGEGKPIFELYNIENDPEEIDNLFQSNSNLAKDLVEELETKLEGVNQPYL